MNTENINSNIEEQHKLIEELNIKKNNLDFLIEEANNNLIKMLAKEYEISIGDKILLDDEKEVVIYKFFIGHSRNFKIARDYKKYLSEEEIINYEKRKFALYAECYDINKNGNINKTIKPEYNGHCLESSTLIEKNFLKK